MQHPVDMPQDALCQVCVCAIPRTARKQCLSYSHGETQHSVIHIKTVDTNAEYPVAESTIYIDCTSMLLALRCQQLTVLHSSCSTTFVDAAQMCTVFDSAVLQDNLVEEVAGINTVPNEKQQHDITAGISNSFGFGGHNSVVAFAAYKD